MIAIFAGLLALLPGVAARARQGAIGGRAAAAVPLFPLFITGDVTDEFLTPGVDTRAVLWWDTPVSRDGARARMEARQNPPGRITPLVLDARPDARRESGQVNPLENRAASTRNRRVHECIQIK